MKQAIRTVENLFSEVHLKSGQHQLPPEALEFPVFVPIPYLNRIEKGNPQDPLLRQVLPVREEAFSPEHFEKDPLDEESATIESGLLKKYRGRVLVIASGSCAINCRYCFRRHFPYETASLGQSRWQQVLASIRSDLSINEIILSGGDPLTVPDGPFAKILDRICSIEHIEKIRIHSRLPIVIPQRVTSGLLEAMRRFRNSRADRQVYFVVHTNHPNELDSSVCEALKAIKNSVTQLMNQSVLLAGVNDDVDTLAQLSERLLVAETLPYYLHQLDPIQGTAHFEVPISRGVDLVREMRKRLPGFGVPRYVQELAGEPNKTVLA